MEPNASLPPHAKNKAKQSIDVIVDDATIFVVYHAEGEKGEGRKRQHKPSHPQN
jgi:hypothetical protein